MLDMPNCPICRNKMSSLKIKDKHFPLLNKQGSWIRRVCLNSHLFCIYSDLNTKSVDFLKMNFNHKYSDNLEINFVKNYSTIIMSQNFKIDVPKIVDLDFPDLFECQKEINLYILMS